MDRLREMAEIDRPSTERVEATSAPDADAEVARAEVELREVAAMQLALTVAVATARAPESDERVRMATRRLVTVLKSEGWPVEAIIVQIKKTATRISVAAARHASPPNSDLPDAETLLADTVRWCIEHYYRAD